MFIYLIDSLRSLHITNSNVDIRKLNKLRKLEYLDLTNSNINDLNNKFELNNLIKLHIENTNIKDLSIIEDTNIKELSIDREQAENNKEIIHKLINNDVVILDEGITVLNEVI